jgi:hypothetical protein
MLGCNSRPCTTVNVNKVAIKLTNGNALLIKEIKIDNMAPIVMLYLQGAYVSKSFSAQHLVSHQCGSS